MNSNSFKPAGIAAIALAVLFPVYWLYVVVFSFENDGALWLEFSTLNLWDLLFVVVGLLEIYVFLALREFIRHQLSSGLMSVLLIVMVILIALFKASVLVDVALAMGLFTEAKETVISVATGFSFFVGYLFAVVTLIFATVLLSQFTSLNSLMKIFAVGLLVDSVFQLTIILAGGSILLFPILMIILAVQFLRGEQSIEVV